MKFVTFSGFKFEINKNLEDKYLKLNFFKSGRENRFTYGIRKPFSHIQIEK